MLTLPVVAAVSIAGKATSHSKAKGGGGTKSPPRVTTPTGMHPALSDVSLLDTSSNANSLAISSSGMAPSSSGSGDVSVANGVLSSSDSADNDNADGVSLFAAALEQLPHVRDANGDITTEGFCRLCELTLPCIDSFGPAFVMVHNDITTNIKRLRARVAGAPDQFATLAPILDDDAARGDLGDKSCVKAVLWLKRGMEFMLEIMRRVPESPPDEPFAALVTECYRATIHQWHGWLAASAFNVAIAFVPTRGAFLARLAGGRHTPAAAGLMAEYVARFGALLEEVHALLDARGLDDPAKV